MNLTLAGNRNPDPCHTLRPTILPWNDPELAVSWTADPHCRAVVRMGTSPVSLASVGPWDKEQRCGAGWGLRVSDAVPDPTTP